jgi:hypothetical protein
MLLAAPLTEGELRQFEARDAAEIRATFYAFDKQNRYAVVHRAQTM